MIKHRFSKSKNLEFATVLKERVSAYFAENDIQKSANARMIFKSIIIVGLYLALYFMIMLGNLNHTGLMFLLWALIGLAMAFIGTTVMHDALHGSYSKNSKISAILSFSAYIVGANPRIWKIQHNMLHHTFTNIEHADGDIHPRFIMRFTPHQERRWFHRWQYLYAFVIYSLITLVWVTFKDFTSAAGYKKDGLIKAGKDYNNLIAEIIIQKLAYHGVFLVLPLILLPFHPGLIVLMFITMHVVGGLTLSLIFQCAHVTPTSEFVKPESTVIEENWAVHQLLTTSNFAIKNPVIGWFFGGLNFQIEHHLFPNICHVHYRKIAKIIKNTAKEYNLPYYTHKTFIGAVMSHLKHLRILGRQDELVKE